MILRKISVRGWRCFVDTFEVGPFSDGLNVLFAPNAFGKSTLFDALLRALFDGHRVGGAQMEAVRPWGRVLAPQVDVEFFHDGQEYSLSKRFLDKPASELSRKEGGKFARLAESDAADEQVRQVLCGKPSLHGLTRASNWGICQALWAPQGEMKLAGISSDVVANIQESLGAQVSGGQSASKLEEKIGQLYDRYYTSTGRLKAGKGGAPVLELTGQLDKARAELQDLSLAVIAFEEASRRVEDSRAQRSQAKLNAAETSRELEKARGRAKEYTALRAKQGEQLQKVEASGAKHSELSAHIASIAEAKKDLKAAKDELEQLEAKAPLQLKEVEQLDVEANVAKADLEKVRQGRGAVETADRESRLARRYLDTRDRLADEQALVDKVTEAEKKLRERREERNRLVAPDSRSLSAIREAIRDRDDAGIRLEAVLITLEIVPEKSLKLDVLEAEKLETIDLKPGVSSEIKGAPEVVVDISGVARVRARGPAGSVEELRDTLAAAADKVERLTLEYGTSELAKLESLAERHKELYDLVTKATTVLDTLLAERSFEEIEQERSRLAAQFEELLTGHEEWRQTPPDHDDMEAAARKIRDSFVSAVEEAEKLMDAAQGASSSAGKRHSALQADLESTKRRVATLAEKVEKLQADGKDEARRAEQLKALALEWDAARAGLEQTEGELKAMGEDPARSVAKLEASLSSAEEAARDALEKEKSEEGRLGQLASEGNYSRATVAEESVVSLGDKIRREELRVNAVKLLHDTVDACRKQAIEAISKPVEDLATDFMTRIAGPRLGGVSVSGDFTPIEVNPGAIDNALVSIDQLSGGEQEQVHFAVRLALAEVLAKNERQLVVLDDALTATDTGRFARVLSLIEDVASKLQVLILTCHPEKYRALDQAAFFDLERIAAGN